MIQSLSKIRSRRIARSLPRLILVALALEIGARAIIHIAPFLEPMVPVAVGRFDERLGWSLQPNTSATSRRSGFPIEYRINSKGLRDEETPYEKTRGVFRIALLGDSNTFGHGVPIEKHFSTLLEGYLRNVEVVNMGVSGYGVDQELLYLRHEGFKYDPDLVLVYVPHYGDQRHMHSERFGQRKPRFEARGEHLALSNYPVTYELLLPRALLPLHRWCVSISKLCEVTHVRVTALTRSSPRRLSSIEKQERTGLGGVSEKPTYLETDKLGAQIIREMGDECRARTIPFVLVTRISTLHEAMVSSGHKSLDVSRALTNAKFKIPDDNHDNEAANGALAWEIAQFLLSSGLLPTNSSPVDR